MNTITIGAKAEQLACRFLQTQGLTRVSQNFNRRIGEIDLVMFDSKNESWVLVEVRYRKNHQYGLAISSVDLRKQRKLRRVARAFLQTAQPQRCRIDVVGLSPLSAQTPKQAEFAKNLYGRITTDFEEHRVDWIINAVED